MLTVIQFARLAGFSPIIVTASLHNTELLRSLGATHVFTYDALSDKSLAKQVKQWTSKSVSLSAIGLYERTEHSHPSLYA